MKISQITRSSSRKKKYTCIKNTEKNNKKYVAWIS